MARDGLLSDLTPRGMTLACFLGPTGTELTDARHGRVRASSPESTPPRMTLAGASPARRALECRASVARRPLIRGPPGDLLALARERQSFVTRQ